MSLYETPDSLARAKRLREIRRQIEEGEYETPDRLDKALAALLDRLEEGDERHD